MQFPRDPAVVRKFIVALVGFVLIVAAQFGLVVPDVVSEQLGALIDAGISLATAVGVFAVPNKAPAPPAPTAPVLHGSPDFDMPFEDQDRI